MPATSSQPNNTLAAANAATRGDAGDEGPRGHPRSDDTDTNTTNIATRTHTLATEVTTSVVTATASALTPPTQVSHANGGLHLHLVGGAGIVLVLSLALLVLIIARTSAKRQAHCADAWREFLPKNKVHGGRARSRTTSSECPTTTSTTTTTSAPNAATNNTPPSPASPSLATEATTDEEPAANKSSHYADAGVETLKFVTPPPVTSSAATNDNNKPPPPFAWHIQPKTDDPEVLVRWKALNDFVADVADSFHPNEQAAARAAMRKWSFDVRRDADGFKVRVYVPTANASKNAKAPNAPSLERLRSMSAILDRIGEAVSAASTSSSS